MKIGEDTFKKGLKWIPGHESNLNFWADCWSNLGSIRAFIQGPLPLDSSTLKLKDVISMGRWDWSKIPFNLPLGIREEIQATPIPLIARNNDKLAWKFSPKGSFDMGSAYLIASNLMEAESFAGSWIWKLQTLPRIQMFIWRCMHNSIAVKEVIAKRGILIDTSCPMCQSEAESLTHALQDCNMVKPFWLKLGTNCLCPSFFSQGIKDWLISNSSLKSSQNAAGLPWNILFPYAIWMIWKQRNNVCFSNKRPNPNLDKVVTKLATDFLLYGAKQNRNIHMVVRQVRWEKPDMGWFKLNTDGAANGSAGNATGGGLIRDDCGNWVMGFSRKIGRVDSFVAEIWPLRDGLQLCRQLNIDAIVIELDAKSLVDVLNNSSYCNTVISPLLDDCKLLIDQFP